MTVASRTPRAGTLNRRATIQQPKVVGNLQTWTTFARVWVSVTNQVGLEQAQQLNPTNIVTCLVTMRYQAGVRPKMRVLLGTRILQIMSVVNVEEANTVLELVCRESPA